MSILNAANSASVRPVVEVHGGTGAAVEVQAARTGTATANRTAPIEAAGTDIVERTTTAAAVARHGQFKRGGKSPCCITGGPTYTLGI